MTTHSRRSKKVYGEPSKISPVSKLQSPQGKSPSAFVEKETVLQESPRDVQAIESVYEFFTKQRPLAWTYFNEVVYEPLLTTGSSFANSSPTSVLITEIDVNECLLVSHFEASILYRPIPEGTAVGDIQDGYYVPLETPSIPVARTTGSTFNSEVGFLFNLRAQESALYDASVNVREQNYAGFLQATGAPKGGFTHLNANVLESAENSSALYVFETGPVTVDFTCIDSSSGSGNVPKGFFPYGLAWSLPLGDLRIGPVVMFNVRGHALNKNDAELLKILIQNN